jgi:hypothetical protein
VRANGGGGQNASVNKLLLAYLEKQQGTTKYLVAVTSSTEAAPYIIQTGKAVTSLGGFTGSNPILTTAQLEKLIKTNVVRYFLTGGNGNSTAISYVQSVCKAVSASTYQSSTTSSASGAVSTGGGGSSSQLYDCGQSDNHKQIATGAGDGWFPTIHGSQRILTIFWPFSYPVVTAGAEAIYTMELANIDRCGEWTSLPPNQTSTG